MSRLPDNGCSTAVETTRLGFTIGRFEGRLVGGRVGRDGEAVGNRVDNVGEEVGRRVGTRLGRAVALGDGAGLSGHVPESHHSNVKYTVKLFD